MQFQKTVIVRAGVLGSIEEGIGQAFVVVDLPDDKLAASKVVGREMAAGYRRALDDAVTDLYPRLPAMFKRDQAAG